MLVNQAIQCDSIYEIYFEYTPSKVAVLRCLPGWKWDTKKKCGTAKAIPAVRELLLRQGFTVDDDVIDFDFGETPAEVNDNLRAPYDGPILSDFISGCRQYQIEGVRQIIGFDNRALLADEMGLGKTVQALTWLEHLDGSPAVVVTTASTKFNWQEEARKWTTRLVHVISGRTVYPLPAADLYIINYNILSSWDAVLVKMKPVALVLDEAHNIKNPKADKSKAAKTVSKRTPAFLALTGTPIMSNPIEMFPLLNLIDKTTFPSRPQFGMEFCNPQIDKWSGTINYVGVSNVEKLAALLKRYVIRRLKSEVLQELPAKQRTRVDLDIINRPAYEKVASTPLKDLSHMGIRNRLQALMSLSAKGKMPGVFDWIDDVLSQGEKLFVGVYHTDIVNMLMDRYKKRALSITGATPVAHRLPLCKQFDTDPSKMLMVGQLEAAGEGLNLQAACSNVAFVEYPWTPSRLVQFEDRVHRFGQSKGVSVWYLVATGTIEEHLLDILLSKADIISSVLDEASEFNSTVKELSRFLSKTCFGV